MKLNLQNGHVNLLQFSNLCSYRKKLKGTFGEIKAATTIQNGLDHYIYHYPKERKVITLAMDDFYVKNQQEILITYGIVTCCGLVAIDKNRIFLMHISPGTDVQEIIDTLDANEFYRNFYSLLVPGLACYVDYENLKNYLEKKNCTNSVYQFKSRYGVIVVDKDTIILGNDKKIEEKIKIKGPKN